MTDQDRIWPAMGQHLIGALLLAVLVYLDREVADLPFVMFYLVPVVWESWYYGRRAGIAVACLCVLLWVGANHPEISGRGNLFLVWSVMEKLVLFVLTSVLISMFRSNRDRIRDLARLDFLTKAYNKRYFCELAEREIYRFQRYNRPFSLAYIDTDNLKTINDTYGHHEGDQLLVLIARTMQAAVRKTDIVTRVGGDEFVILLAENNYTQASVAIAKVKSQLDAVMGAHRYGVTFSIGLVSFLDPPASVDQMLRLSDSLMYRVKASGKNAICHEKFGLELTGDYEDVTAKGIERRGATNERDESPGDFARP
ncbi:GGDEF domain-containing protein [Geomobilimonas luticola]|uniref:diguanylate cyclase n=1 Tax=Geomobilimonas luticola TaxID=1114878 RepID=A0ABS5SCZ6_9BACT|nr:diguanylate cyclase [Geomobilimonas luticola]MBT0653244.1 GGDEF domain-containing protein [Geomobilimonas luticola]